MKYTLILCLLSLRIAVLAQTTVNNFTLTSVADGSTVALDNCSGCKGTVIIFTSNACVYDKYYSDRIKDLAASYPGQIQFLLVNSCQEPEESVDKMKAFHAFGGPSITLLADKDQVAMNALGAKRSPEVFLLKKIKDQFSVMYTGAIDDNPMMATAVTKNYLKTAIDKLLAGQEIDMPVTRAVGCSIRKK